MVAAARQRHDDTRRKATGALRRLDAAGEPISFAAVARAGGISRAWLYRDAAVRAEIDRLRRPRSATIGVRSAPSKPAPNRSVSNLPPSAPSSPSCVPRTVSSARSSPANSANSEQAPPTALLMSAAMPAEKGGLLRTMKHGLRCVAGRSPLVNIHGVFLVSLLRRLTPRNSQTPRPIETTAHASSWTSP